MNEEFENQRWLARHKQKLKEISERKRDINLVFIGDSIIHAWEDKGKQAWAACFAKYGALNLGFSGDKTENVLWRIHHGEIDSISPTLIVLMIGTNNTGHRKDPAQHTANEITQIIDEIHLRLPDTHILLHAILPRAKRPNNKLRIINNEINKKIINLQKRDYVHWIDAQDLFIDENGILDEDKMSDFLHPDAHQYEAWAEFLLPTIEALMCK